MNRTEEPTPKRKREAREQGQVALSSEFTGVAVLVATLGVLVFWMPTVAERLVAILREAVALAGRPDLQSDHVSPFVMHALTEIAWILFPLLAIAALVAGFVTFVQVGPLFTVDPLIPKGERLDPFNGFKQIIGRDRLVELAKHLGKLSVMAGIGAWVFSAWFPDVLSMIRVDLIDSLGVLEGAVTALGFALVGGLVLFGVLDLVWQRYRHRESLMMTRREVEDEHKASEGDPQVAGERKRMHREMLNEAGNPEDVREADAVVVNPTHVAVGLHYDADSMQAPEIVASGKGVRARAIKRIARQYQIPVIHNVTLARSLYRDGELHRAIPPDYYEPVAEVLKFAYSMSGHSQHERSRPNGPQTRSDHE